MYTEESVIDTINVRDTGHVEIRTSNRVLKDGVIISTTYHRHVCDPDSDMTKEDARVKAISTASWTPDIVAKFKAGKAKNKP